MKPPFGEDHELFRKQVRKFAEEELGPHTEKWEEDELFPNWVFKKAGELGILGAHYPEDVGGGGGDYWFSVVKSEELVRCRSGGVTGRWNDPCSRAVSCLSEPWSSSCTSPRRCWRSSLRSP